MMEGQRNAQSQRRHTRAAVIVAVDAVETVSSSSSSLSWDRGQRQRRLTNGMEEDAVRREDNTTAN